jgi:hypothetical protein
MNFEVINELVSELAILPFYPSEPGARLAVVRMVGDMAHNEEQVRWLVSAMTSGAFSKWEGPGELRAVFCMKFRPRDGIECASAIYPDGMTREQLNPGMKALPAAPVLRLAAGEVSADAEANEIALASFAGKDLNAVRGFPLAPTVVRSDETEVAALIRAIAETRQADRGRQPKPATAEEIERIKRLQAASAANEETRAILAGNAEVVA